MLIEFFKEIEDQIDWIKGHWTKRWSIDSGALQTSHVTLPTFLTYVILSGEFSRKGKP